MKIKDKTMIWWTLGIAVALVIVIANTNLNKKMFSMTLAITSGNLDYVKSKCGINNFYNVYQCGSYYCVDSLSGRCVDVDVNCKNAPVVYNCLNLGGGTTTGCTKSGSNLLINGKIVATDSCSNPTLAVIGTAYKNLYLCNGVSAPSNFVAVSGDLGGYVKYQGSDPSCSTQCTPTTERCSDGSLRLQDSHCNLLPCPTPTVTPPPTICSQESGTLCNPSTKGLITYSDSCQKSTLINSGHTTDFSKCEAISPPLPPPVMPPPTVTPPPPTCPFYSPLQCGADEDLVSSVDSAGCPTSQCVKKQTSPVSPLVYITVVSIIIIVVGVIWYFGFRTTKGKKK